MKQHRTTSKTKSGKAKPDKTQSDKAKSEKSSFNFWNFITCLFSKIGDIRHGSKESILCNRIAIYLRNKCLDGLRLIWFHVPNESNGGARYGKKLNAIGRIAGAPDYVLMTKDKTCLVEVKTDKGILSKNQKIFSSWCSFCNVDYVVVRSLEEMEAVVKSLS